MESRDQREQPPVLLETTVVNENTGQPVCTLIKLPLGTTIESLANILKHNNQLPAVRKEVITLGERVRQVSSSDGRDEDESGRLEIDTTEDEAVDDETSRTDSGCASPPAAGSLEDAVASVEQGRDTLPTPPSSPSPGPSTSLPDGALFLAVIPESSRAGCHNGHKAAILGGRYVLQKTNSRARLTGPFYCNACGLRFDWHSSARMHLNFHNRDYEACEKCTKRQQNAESRSSGRHSSTASGDESGSDKAGRPPRCTVCNKSFYLWKTYLAHQNKHKDKVKCPLCCKFFQSLHNVGRHYYDEHSGVHITCSICGNGYRAFRQYQTHMETLHMTEERVRMPAATQDDDGGVNYSIDLPTLQQLDPSIRVFSSVERTCPVPKCGRIFSTQHTMQRHIYDLHSNELLPCGLCGNAYRTYMQFERHCELFHGENFRIELPVGEIPLPSKRKRDSVVSEGGEYMKSIPPLPRPKAKTSKASTSAGSTPTTATASAAGRHSAASSAATPTTSTISRDAVASMGVVTTMSSARKRSAPSTTKFGSTAPLDEPLDMTLVKMEPFYDVILPD
ncbi:hypothetical protein BIW11_01273 [Tropilaelaps mercedesae]|uniref:C2H2-type domain-containing protein n=1 Tax=Tropilaelaps mercedesae TaxID=418985 RepID=A0A1V9XGV4_9ACAR|nr:hypothetical protein BIW11_01273 [Tropilaelaps mercedesae]